MANVITGIIVGHQEIGRALLKALEAITGSHEHIHCFSNNGLSTSELSDAIRQQVTRTGAAQVLIFVDIYGGSCWRAAKMAKLPESHIVTGLNLPMLLSFVSKRHMIAFEELPAVIEEDGKRGITQE